MPWTFSALWLSFRIGLLCSVIMVLQKRLQAVRLQDKPIYLCINIWIDARLLDICTYRYVISYNVSFFYYTVLLISLLSYTYIYILLSYASLRRRGSDPKTRPPWPSLQRQPVKSRFWSSWRPLCLCFKLKGTVSGFKVYTNCLEFRSGVLCGFICIYPGLEGFRGLGV